MSSNEIAVREDPAPPALPGAPTLSGDAMERLRGEIELMASLYKYAEQICSSQFVPDIYQGKPANAAVAMMYGANFGLAGITALQNVFLTKGKPSTYARIMYAAVLSAGHEMWEEPGATDESVTWYGRRRGADVIFSTTWTIERAKKAGYTSNAKYGTNGAEMLRAKCQAETARVVAADILAGMPFNSREELEMEPEPVRAKAERIHPGVSGLRGKLGLDPVTPAGDATDTTSVQPDPAAGSTDAQRRTLGDLLGKEGLTDTGEALAWLSGQVRRDLASPKDLTIAEAADLIEFLQAEQAKDAK